jgi:TRAP-type C4-dicarboxylate transport system substrate-binding protein
VAAAKSDGKFNVKVFDGCGLGSDTQAIASLRGGCCRWRVPRPRRSRRSSRRWGARLPFVFADAREVDTVLDGPLGQALLDKLPEKDLVGLAYMENGSATPPTADVRSTPPTTMRG